MELNSLWPTWKRQNKDWKKIWNIHESSDLTTDKVAPMWNQVEQLPMMF